MATIVQRMKYSAVQDAGGSLSLLRERWGDPLLTVLTILLVFILFVAAPLQAVGVILFQALGFAFALVFVCGIFVISGSQTAVVALLVAVAMAGTATIFRLQTPSI